MSGTCHATYGGFACLDPATEMQSCAARAPSLPSAPWGGAANEFYLPLGPMPGRGTLLMLASSLARLDRTAAHTLEFSDGTDKVRLRNITIAYAAGALPGGRRDGRSSFWLEVVDRRHLAAGGGVLNTAYNVLDADGTAYLSGTKNGGSTWTWAAMLEAIWTANGLLGTWPGLPSGFSPDGSPESFIAYGRPSYDLLNEALDSIGCALRLDLITDTFSIVQVGASDAAAERALRRHDRLRVWDSYPVDVARGRLPETIRVLFPVIKPGGDGTGASPFYTLDRTDTSTGGGVGDVAGTVAVIQGGMSAVYSTAGVLSNGTALGTRADERAEDWFRRMRLPRLHRIYTGLHDDFLPGARLKGVRWHSQGMGGLTEVMAHPGYGPPGTLLEGASGPGESPAFPSSGGPSGGGSGMDGTAGSPGGPGIPGTPGGGGTGGGGIFPGNTPGMPGRNGLPGGGGGPWGIPGGGINFGIVNNLPGGTSLWLGLLWPVLRQLVDEQARFAITNAGVPSGVPYLHTRWQPPGYTGPLGAVTALLDTILYFPFIVERTQTLNGFAIDVQSAVGASNSRVGLYSSTSTTNPTPGSLVVDSGNISCAATGLQVVAASQELSPGLYWLALLSSSSSIALTGATSTDPDSHWGGIKLGLGSGGGAGGVLDGNPAVAWTEALAFGALPSTATPVIQMWAGSYPLPFFRIAS
jgi:hypothetical protein